jgi:hypothetical protein
MFSSINRMGYGFVLLKRTPPGPRKRFSIAWNMGEAGVSVHSNFRGRHVQAPQNAGGPMRISRSSRERGVYKCQGAEVEFRSCDRISLLWRRY